MRQAALIALVIKFLSYLLAAVTCATPRIVPTRAANPIGGNISPPAASSTTTVASNTTSLLDRLGFEPLRANTESPVHLTTTQRFFGAPAAKTTRAESSLARQARLNNLGDTDDDDHHHRQLDSKALSDERAPQDAAAVGAKRASRNIRRKMEFVSDRVNQIESHIESDQRGSSALTPATTTASLQSNNNGGEYPSSYVTEADADTADNANPLLTGSDMATDRPVSRAPSGVVNHIESPQSGEPQWSAAVASSPDSEDQQEAVVSHLHSGSGTANDTRKWSQQIRSVVPTQQLSLVGAPEASEDGGGAQESAGSEMKNSAGDQNQVAARRYDASNSLDQSPAVDESNLETSGGGNTTQQNNRYTSGLILNEPQGASESIPDEWTHQNMDYFRQMNAKNHANGPVQQVHATNENAMDSFKRNKFGNMTILDSDKDLSNSFSNVRQQHHQPPATTSTTRRPTASSGSGSGSGSGAMLASASSDLPTVSGGTKRSSVSQFSPYKSSKERFVVAATTKQPPLSIVGDANSIAPDRSLSNTGDSDYSTNSAVSRVNDTNYDSSPLRWPSFAYPTQANEQSASGNAAYSNRYADNQLAGDQSTMDTTRAGNQAADNAPQQGDKLRRYSNLIGNGDSAVVAGAASTTSSGRQSQASGNNYHQLATYNNNGLPIDNYLHHGSPTGAVRRLANDQRAAYANDEQSGPNNSYEALKHRSSGGNPDESLGGYPQDSYTAASANNFDRGAQVQQDSMSSGGAYGYSPDSSSDGSDSSKYTRSRTPLNSATLTAQDQRNLYNALGGGGAGSEQVDNSLAYSYQQANSAGLQQGQSTASSNLPAEAAQVSRSAQSDGAESEAARQASYEQALMYANARNSYQQQLDAMQPAATTTNSNNNNLLRQHRLGQMAAAIVAQNPSLSQMDLSALLQRYQQQQLLLAAQVQQQQQQQQLHSQQQQVAQLESQLNAYGASLQSAYQQQQQQQVQSQQREPGSGQNAYRRYAAETYQLARPPASSYGVEAADLTPYSSAAPSNFQPVYSASSSSASSAPSSQNYNNLMDTRSLKATNLAVLRAALAAANKSNNNAQQQFDQSALLAAYPAQGYSGGSTGNNYSGALYATSAINSPAFYESPQQSQKSADSSATTAASGSGANSELSRQQYAPSPVYKRGYLNSLFKPTASSRYYYTPTILSPISLGSPAAAMHSLYAPAALATAAEPMSAASLSGQIYADPYGQHSAAAIDQAAQQYQAYAAAANGLQPAHYMTEPEMAESAVAPTDSAAYATDAGNSQTSAGQSGSDTAPDSSNQSSSKSGKGLTPWTNIAGLLLGILPFGILMASLLPAVSVAGRKKRELEFNGRNFSDLLKWRPPSKVLSALIGGFGQQDALLAATNASAFNEIAKLGLFGQANASSGDNNNNKHRAFGARSVSGSGPLKVGSTARQLMFDRSNGSDIAGTGYQLVSATGLDGASSLGALNPLSATGGTNSSATLQANGVKAKVLKALSALNNLIVAHAQNIKRKHRSSIVDNQWTLPLGLRNTLKLEKLLNIKEFKRQLDSVIQTNKLSRAFIAQQQQQMQETEHPVNETSAKVSSSLLKVNDLTESKRGDEGQQAQRVGGSNERTNTSLASGAKSATRIEPTAAPAPSEPVEPLRYNLDKPNTKEQLKTKGSSSPLFDSAETDKIIQDNHLARHPVHNPVLGQITQTVQTEPIQVQVELAPVKLSAASANQQAPAVDKTSNPSMRQHLEVCLNQFLCRFAVKLRKGLKSSFRAAPQSEQQTTRLKSNSTEMAPERVERLTKNYIKQIINRIEAENPIATSQLNKMANTTDTPGAQFVDKPEHQLDVLYKNALRNQCDLMYNCSELIQIEKSLLRMKLVGL